MTFKFKTMYLLYLHTKAIIIITILISTIYFLIDINMNGIGLKRKGSTSIKYSFTVYDEFYLLIFIRNKRSHFDYLLDLKYRSINITTKN